MVESYSMLRPKGEFSGIKLETPAPVFCKCSFLRYFKFFKSQVLILLELQARFFVSADGAALAPEWRFPPKAESPTASSDRLARSMK
jgi:hypothetical protein